MAYTKEDSIEQSGGVVRISTDLVVIALDPRRPGLLSRTEANSEAVTPEIFFAPIWGWIRDVWWL